VHDVQWLVKYGAIGVAGEAEYREEAEYLEKNSYAEILARGFKTGGIDYGRADFGFYGGKLQIYEINTNPHIHSATRHPFALRERNLAVARELYLEALAGLDSGGGAKPGLWQKPEKKTRLHRLFKKWKSKIVSRMRTVSVLGCL
jgi:hypothetical protein